MKRTSKYGFFFKYEIGERFKSFKNTNKFGNIENVVHGLQNELEV